MAAVRLDVARLRPTSSGRLRFHGVLQSTGREAHDRRPRGRSSGLQASSSQPARFRALARSIHCPDPEGVPDGASQPAGGDTKGGSVKISIFGLGYVGTVTMACLARDGHDVVGVDVNAEKVGTLAAGRSPIVEPGLTDLLARALARGALRATTVVAEAVAASDVSLISVGTPSQDNGAPDLGFVERVFRDIGVAARIKDRPHTVVLRS